MKTYHWTVTGIMLTSLALAATTAVAGDPEPAGLLAGGALSARAIGLGLCATLTMTLSEFGAAYAVARIGSAAMGAAAEKPELLTRSILFVALAEGLAFLGFAISIILIQKI